MKFDMHCHTKEGSMDGKVIIEEFIRRLEEKGFGGMLVSDHNSYDGYRKWKNSIKGKQHYDFVVLKGVEYDTMDCGHILVIMPEGVKLWILEMRGLPVGMLIKIVHYYGGILGPAHPFGEKYMSAMTTRQQKIKYAKRLSNLVSQFDFIEIFNACEKKSVNDKAYELAREYAKPGFGGSDAHKTDCIGMGYTDLPEYIRSESDLIAYVKTGPQIECGGTFYERTTKDRLGKAHAVLVESFYVYNKMGNAFRSYKRHKELKNIFDRQKGLH
ncbi:PHP-associated domain-containing protein [Novisyntrophococcus fermenticellae]|uniref:PHP-associated domain-containing protein n=1 Tax=Novisyntrophococcus fermenticellae TaxID=2068655 RepID=UPI001E620A91|nr:PHP domain-containing protein [Novisyntrophococcus fermenticellae]